MSCLVRFGKTNTEDVVHPRSGPSQKWSIPEDDESAALSPDGRLVITGHTSGHVHFWSVADPQSSTDVKYGGAVYGVAFRPDGKQLAIASRDIHLLDTSTRREVAKIRGHLLSIHSINYSPDGSRIITGGGVGSEAVKIWDVSVQQELMTLTTTDGFSFRQVGFSPDGNSILTIGGSRSLYVWHAPTLEEIDAYRN